MFNIDSSFNNVAQAGIWFIISMVIAIIGGICVYYVLLTKENYEKCTGYTKKLFDFVTFKKLILEDILKILYIIVAIYITISSLGLISTSFVLFLVQLVFGNIIARIGFEFSLLMITICKNTTEINDKLKQNIVPKREEKKESKKEEKKEEKKEDK